MTTSLIIVLSIVLIIVGFILALLVTPLLGLEKKLPKVEPTQEEDPETLMGRPQSQAADRSLRVAHDPRDNRIIIEIDGQIYKSVEALARNNASF